MSSIVTRGHGDNSAQPAADIHYDVGTGWMQRSQHHARLAVSEGKVEVNIVARRHSPGNNYGFGCDSTPSILDGGSEPTPKAEHSSHQKDLPRAIRHPT